jgi:hypothetical protein
MQRLMSTLHPPLAAGIEGSTANIFDLIAACRNMAPVQSVRRDNGNIARSGPSWHNLSRRGTGWSETRVRVQISGLLKLGPLVVHTFRKENVRILAELKR